MRSLRSQLTLIVAGLALLAVGAVTVTVALTTNRALEQTLADQAEARQTILEELNELALEIDWWDEAELLIEELAEDFSARIALTDVDGFVLLDTGDGELPPLEGVIDPFGPLAEFTDDFLFDTETFNDELAGCLEEASIAYLIDESGELFLIGDDFNEEAAEILDECYQFAVVAAEKDQGGVKEPALLFVEFETTPAIPWTAIGLVAAAVIAIAAATAAPLSGIVTGSLRRLSAAAHSIRQGDLDVRVEADAPAEVADLADSFNEMTTALAIAEERRKQLTADVAHELRSPLTNILGHLDAIEDGVIAASPDQVGIISSEAVRLARLVDDLQTLAALDEHTLTLETQPTDLCALVDRALGARRVRAADSSIAIQRMGECRSPISIDPTRIDQIIGNLLDNALEHTPPDGTVTARIEDTEDEVTVSVQDTGPGIDPGLLPRVFDRLSRADTARTPGNGGRGLGLAIARGLARTHGGDIEATNDPDGGARFTLTLPRSES